MKKNPIILDAISRMAMSLRSEHWQAIVAAKGVPYPYSAIEKVKVLERLFAGRDEGSIKTMMITE